MYCLKWFFCFSWNSPFWRHCTNNSIQKQLILRSRHPRNLIASNIKIFSNREVSFCEFLKFFGQPRNLFLKNSNFENLEILMNCIPIKYDNSLMKVKKSNKSRLNSLLLHWNWFMWNGLLISKIAWPHPKGNKLISGDWSGAGITKSLKNWEFLRSRHPSMECSTAIWKMSQKL